MKGCFTFQWGRGWGGEGGLIFRWGGSSFLSGGFPMGPSVLMGKSSKKIVGWETRMVSTMGNPESVSNKNLALH